MIFSRKNITIIYVPLIPCYCPVDGLLWHHQSCLYSMDIGRRSTWKDAGVRVNQKEKKIPITKYQVRTENGPCITWCPRRKFMTLVLHVFMLPPRIDFDNALSSSLKSSLLDRFEKQTIRDCWAYEWGLREYSSTLCFLQFSWYLEIEQKAGSTKHKTKYMIYSIKNMFVLLDLYKCNEMRRVGQCWML